MNHMIKVGGKGRGLLNYHFMTRGGVKQNIKHLKKEEVFAKYVSFLDQKCKIQAQEIFIHKSCDLVWAPCHLVETKI